MPDTTILALVAGAAVVALVAIIASRRRRRRQLADEIGELPAYLYLASHTPENTPRNGTTPPNGGRLTAGTQPNGGRLTAGTQPNGGRLTAGTQPNGGPAAGGGGLQTNGAPGTPAFGLTPTGTPRPDGGTPHWAVRNAPAQHGNGSALPARTTVQPGAETSPILGWAPTVEGTIRLLPGRLEPVPDDAGQEIRFVQRPGVTRFTFGRSRGPAHEHVQLRLASVSRMHAWMEFADGRWRIGPLSTTNAVLVNGKPLDPGDTRTLDDGDRIDMGEAAFVFRQPTLRVQAPVLSRRPAPAQLPTSEATATPDGTVAARPRPARRHTPDDEAGVPPEDPAHEGPG